MVRAWRTIPTLHVSPKFVRLAKLQYNRVSRISKTSASMMYIAINVAYDVVPDINTASATVYARHTHSVHSY